MSSTLPSEDPVVDDLRGKLEALQNRVDQMIVAADTPVIESLKHYGPGTGVTDTEVLRSARTLRFASETATAVVSEAREEAQGIIDAARQQGADMVAVAHLQRNDVISDGERQRREIIADGERQRTEIIAVTKREADALFSSERAHARAATDAWEGQRDEIVGRIEALMKLFAQYRDGYMHLDAALATVAMDLRDAGNDLGGQEILDLDELPAPEGDPLEPADSAFRIFSRDTGHVAELANGSTF